MNTMDEYCAPQWTDFTSSPQVPSEDFFEKEHKVHERRMHIKLEQAEVSFEERTDPILEPQSISQTNMDTLQNIPVKVLSGKSHNNNKHGLVEETTTYSEVLCEAMKNLQLSAKRNKRLNLTVHSICQATTPSFKTSTVSKVRSSQSMGVHRTIADHSQSVPSKKYNSKWSICTPSTSKNVSSTLASVCNDVKTVTKGTKKVPKEVRAEVDKDTKQVLASAIREAGMRETARRSELDSKSDLSSVDSMKAIGNSNTGIQKKLHPNSVTSFSDVSTIAKTVRRSLVQQRPRVLTCQYRRRSLAKYSRRSNQFVSLAEAVSKFQTGTPKRFRSTSQATSKLGPIGNLKQAAKRTVGVSPVLKCKTRMRRVTALSQQEREALELEEIRKHPIKANPINMSVLKGDQILKKLPRKPLTVPEPFNLTKVKKPCEPVEQKQEPIRKKPTVTNVSVPIVVSASDSGIVVAKEKVLFFGVPADRNAKNYTHAMPFSFEGRNREIQTRKEQKLKQLQLQESNKTKAEFHARPVPKYTKPIVAAREQNSKKAVVVPCPFSFEKRDKNLYERKEKLVQQVLEEDRKARVFHANPAPVFKPVLVKGRSKENLKAKAKEPEAKKTGVPIPCKKQITREGKRNVEEEQENKEPNIMHAIESNMKKMTERETKSNLAELNTDKRARERRAFDEKVKEKEQADEMKREKEEEERLARERAERAELRKLAEVKAKPMPVYKQLVPSKATKPLTIPQSPAWTSKKKAKPAV